MMKRIWSSIVFVSLAALAVPSPAASADPPLPDPCLGGPIQEACELLMCLIVGQEESRNDKVEILVPPLLSDSGYAEEPDKGYMGVYVLKENTGTDYRYDFSGLVHGYDCLAGGHATVHVRHVDEVKDCLQNLFVPGPDTGDGMNIYTVDPSACYEGLW